MSKLKMWEEHNTWEEAEKQWDQHSKTAEENHPIKSLKKMPNIPGMTPETAKHLKWKSFKWMVTRDHQGEVLKGFFKHPFRYTYRYLRSILKNKGYVRDEDFFYYGISSIEEMHQLLKDENTLLVLGFSYCHKPLECPSGRFNSECIHDVNHRVCQQCFIGKALHALPRKQTIPLIIPTIHYIGGEILDIMHRHPKKQIIFIITACEMTLEMFSDWGNMAGIKGVGVRLDGRICNTMKAFELSEQGIKPGLTVVREGTKSRILDLLKLRTQL